MGSFSPSASRAASFSVSLIFSTRSPYQLISGSPGASRESQNTAMESTSTLTRKPASLLIQGRLTGAPIR